MRRDLRWGLVGASNIAASRMMPAFDALGQCVVAVVSTNAGRAERYAAEFGLKIATTSLAEVVDHSDIDAVYISTTNDRHYEQVMTALAAGKHVLCEKPLALTVADANTMVDAAQRAGLVLAVNHHLPGAGTHRTMQRLVREGVIGTPLAVRVAHAVLLPEHLRSWRLADTSGGGVILDITCHDASAINAVLGLRPLSVTGTAVAQAPWGSTACDAAMATIRYQGAVLAQTHDAFTVQFAQTRFEVHGTTGSINATGVMTQDPIGEIQLVDAGGTRIVPVDDRRNLYEIVLDAFRGAVAGEGRPTVTGAEGAQALAVALAAQESASSGRSVDVALSHNHTN